MFPPRASSMSARVGRRCGRAAPTGPAPCPRAVPALQGMRRAERLLHGAECTIGRARAPIVVTACPSACAASTMHDGQGPVKQHRAGAAHPCSQPRCVPVSQGCPGEVGELMRAGRYRSDAPVTSSSISCLLPWLTSRRSPRWRPRRACSCVDAAKESGDQRVNSPGSGTRQMARVGTTPSSGPAMPVAMNSLSSRGVLASRSPHSTASAPGSGPSASPSRRRNMLGRGGEGLRSIRDGVRTTSAAGGSGSVVKVDARYHSRTPPFPPPGPWSRRYLSGRAAPVELGEAVGDDQRAHLSRTAGGKARPAPAQRHASEHRVRTRVIQDRPRSRPSPAR